jgi:hypothetical protein
VRLEEGLTLGVRLASQGVLVPSAAIELENEALIRPAEVGDHPAAIDQQRLVHVGMLEAGIEEEIERDVLEDAPGGRRTGGDQCRQASRAAGRPDAVEHFH